MKEHLENKIKELEEKKDTLIKQAEAQIHIFEGAIQNCKELLEHPTVTEKAKDKD